MALCTALNERDFHGDIHAEGRVETRKFSTPHPCAVRRYGATEKPSWRLQSIGDWR
jgi:hypothetical protein